MEPFIPPVSRSIFCPVGIACPDPKPGDFLLIVGEDFISRIIRFGQGLRYGFKTPWIQITHTVLVEDESMCIEAVTKGIIRSPLAKYQNHAYYLLSLDIPEDQRLNVVRFAKHSLNEGYGWVDVLSIALTYLTGNKFTFGLDGQECCSGLVARALERTAFIPARDASHIAPIDLASYFFKH